MWTRPLIEWLYLTPVLLFLLTLSSSSRLTGFSTMTAAEAASFSSELCVLSWLHHFKLTPLPHPILLHLREPTKIFVMTLNRKWWTRSANVMITRPGQTSKKIVASALHLLTRLGEHGHFDICPAFNGTHLNCTTLNFNSYTFPPTNSYLMEPPFGLLIYSYHT